MANQGGEAASPVLGTDQLNEERQETRKVLCVGLVCVDVVKVVSHFPEEDSDMRAEKCLWKKGGNAANTASIVGLLGLASEFLGSIAKGPYTQFLQAEFQKYNVATTHSPVVEGFECPVSVVVCNQTNGSRTIIHSNSQPHEISFKEFQRLPLTGENYAWIHFEGRSNFADIEKMLTYIEEINAVCKDKNHSIITSLEIEKPTHINHLIPVMHHADYVFISKEAAIEYGFDDPHSTVEGLVIYCKENGTVICAWGEKGATAKKRAADAPLCASPAFPPERLVDTLGAGDTFNGATIYSLLTGSTLPQAITFACEVAGEKCGMLGFDGLSEKAERISQRL